MTFVLTYNRGGVTMIGTLFHLYDCLAEKERTLDKVVQVLGGDMNSGFLHDELDTLELLIVKWYGGNKGHYTHIASTELFYNYRTYVGENHKTELVDYIQLTIKENWIDEVECHFIRAER
jgi:hypothetical protein